jgi:RimJ/RimL family protein N-acetyltransferase
MVYTGPHSLTAGDLTLRPWRDDDFARAARVMDASRWARDETIQGDSEAWLRKLAAAGHSMFYAFDDAIEGWGGIVYLSFIRLGKDAFINGLGAKSAQPRRSIYRAVVALRVAMKLSCDIFKLLALRADTCERNRPARRVLEAAGFELVGKVKFHRWYDGEPYASLIYEHTRED